MLRAEKGITMQLIQIVDGKEIQYEGSPVDVAKKLIKFVDQEPRRLMYSLAKGGIWPGMQFRGWISPFGSVGDGHFDSCGVGMIIHLYGAPYEMDVFLVEFDPILTRMRKWTTAWDQTIIALWAGWAR